MARRILIGLGLLFVLIGVGIQLLDPAPEVGALSCSDDVGVGPKEYHPCSQAEVDGAKTLWLGFSAAFGGFGLLLLLLMAATAASKARRKRSMREAVTARAAIVSAVRRGQELDGTVLYEMRLRLLDGPAAGGLVTVLEASDPPPLPGSTATVAHPPNKPDRLQVRSVAPSSGTWAEIGSGERLNGGGRYRLHLTDGRSVEAEVSSLRPGQQVLIEDGALALTEGEYRGGPRALELVTRGACGHGRTVEEQPTGRVSDTGERELRLVEEVATANGPLRITHTVWRQGSESSVGRTTVVFYDPAAPDALPVVFFDRENPDVRALEQSVRERYSFP